MLNLSQNFLKYITARRLKAANDLYKKHKYKKAICLYQKILQSYPEHYAALCNSASSYFETGDYKTAATYFLHLLKIEPQNPWWHTYLSQIYQKQKSYRKALDSAWRAVKVSHGSMEHQINLSYAFYEIALLKGADFVHDRVEKFYRQYSQSGIAQQCYASFLNSTDFTSCNQEYVEKIFDVFAAEFDKTLHLLQYDSPEVIAQMLHEIYHNENDKLTLLDLGCGSGLCGQAIKKILPSASIYGVDISSQMLHQADQKNVYYHLIKNNIIDYLKVSNLSFDAVVASDVLTYFGDLDKVFNLVFSHLKTSGIFVFNISQNDGRHNWILTISSRFTHSISYVKKQLRKQGFRILKEQQKVIRKEGTEDVKGSIFIVLKP